MNVMNYLDYNSAAEMRKMMMTQSIEGTVYRKHSVNESDNLRDAAPDTLVKASDSVDGRRDSQITQKLMPVDKVIDKAVNSDMKTDKELIGSTSDLESLDISRAISDAKKDNLLKEYRTFVQNPVSEDGIVIRKMNRTGDNNVQL